MRIERSVTSISWIPRRRSTGSDQGRLRGRLHPLRQRPARRDRSRRRRRARAPARRPTASASPTTSPSLVEFADDGSVVDAGYTGGGHIGATTVKLGKRFTVAAVSLPDRQLDPGDRRRLGALHPDGRWADRVSGPAGRPPPAVRAVLRADRLDDVGVDRPRRRQQRAAPRRGVAVPAPLGLRRRRFARRQERPDRLQGLGRHAPSARTRRGATRTRRRSSPRSRRRWNGSCPTSSCTATPSHRSAS